MRNGIGLGFDGAKRAQLRFPQLLKVRSAVPNHLCRMLNRGPVTGLRPRAAPALLNKRRINPCVLLSTSPRSGAPPSASTACSTCSRTARPASPGKLSPFDLIKTGDNDYTIQLAVAGFKRQEIDITAQQNVLLVTGRKADETEEKTATSSTAGSPIARSSAASRSPTISRSRAPT